MKITEHDSATERAILVGQLTDDLVAARIAEQWPEKGGLYASKWANLLGSWAVKHVQKCGHAPRSAIGPLYESWARRSKDTETVETVGNLVESLAEDWKDGEGNAADWLIDQAQIYFTQVKGDKHIRRLQEAWDSGDINEYNEIASSWSAPSVSSSQWVDILQNDAGIDAAYAAQEKPLIVYPGALGLWLGNTFERDAFVAFTGVAKSGKSFVLMDLAARGLEAGLRVAYFSIGDMSEKQVIRRWGSRITGLPRRLPPDGIIQMPVGFDPESPTPSPIFKPKKFTRVADAEIVKKTSRMLRASLGAVARDDVRLRLSVHPAGSVDVFQIESLLRSWQIQGWVPDCFAEGSLVLTDRGEVPIEQVTSSDRLWDGENWVSHDGPICKGERDVITYAGLTATPDHRVYTEDGWRTLESCKRLGLRVAQTGVGGEAVRLGKNYISDSASTHDSAAEWETGPSQVCVCPMHSMPAGEMDTSPKSQTGDCKRLSRVSSAEAVSELVLQQSSGRDDAMHGLQSQSVSSLWGAGDSVPIQIRNGGVLLGIAESPRSNGPVASDRSHRERRTLRAGESSDVDVSAEHSAYLPCPPNAVDACVSACPSCGKLLRRLSHANESQGVDRFANSGSVGPTEQPSKQRVWDIVNAGPLHRFTIQGVLAHNCIVIDYADLIRPAARARDERDGINTTWIHLRGISQVYHCCLVTATQSDTQGYDSPRLTMANFSGDRRKNDHVTANIGLSTTPGEKKFGIVRWGEIASRDAELPNEIAVLGCRGISQPVMFSMIHRSGGEE